MLGSHTSFCWFLSIFPHPKKDALLQFEEYDGTHQNSFDIRTRILYVSPYNLGDFVRVQWIDILVFKSSNSYEKRIYVWQTKVRVNSWKQNTL